MKEAKKEAEDKLEQLNKKYNLILDQESKKSKTIKNEKVEDVEKVEKVDKVDKVEKVEKVKKPIEIVSSCAIKLPEQTENTNAELSVALRRFVSYLVTSSISYQIQLYCILSRNIMNFIF